MSNTVNANLDVAEALFKRLIWDSTSKVLLSSFLESNPVFNIWPMRQVITYFSQVYSDRLFQKMKLIVDVGSIPFIDEGHEEAFTTSYIKLKSIADEKGIQSPEFEEAKNEAQKSFSNFAHFNG